MLDSLSKIALVVPALELGGGVPVVARFLFDVIRQSGLYQADFISLATSSRDKASLRLLAASSWFQGPKVVEGIWQDVPFRHVGAYFTEFEFQRYRPRRILTDLLKRYDLIQVVAGAPTVGLAVIAARRPTCLFVATTCKQERKSLLARARGLRRARILSMTYINSAIECYVLQRVSHVFAESEYSRELLNGIVPSDRLSVGPPGIDTDLFHPGNYNQDGHILSVGRFADPRKNVRMLFHAYNWLRQSMPKAPRLILAGETSPSVEDWNLAVSLGISESIQIRKNVSMRGLAELYRDAALFVLSSNEEGLGIVILEAMASGIPVISTRCGGPETAVIEGKTGYLTSVGNAPEMASRMQELLSSPCLRRQMGQVGRQVAQKRFSLEAAGKVYLEVYENLLQKRV